MRAFIAIELPDEIKAALGRLQDALRTGISRAAWVKPEHQHLTLRFLAEIGDTDVQRLADTLSDQYAGVTPFVIKVSGVGAFPNARRPSVVWAGAGPLEPGLAEVFRIADEAAAMIGLSRESRVFRPHLTLARVRDPKQVGDIGDVLSEQSQFDGGAFEVRHVSLFSSRLTPKGPIHRQIREFIF